MNICIIIPHSNFVTTNTGATAPSGVFYVAASLKDAGHSIYWLEFPDKRPSITEITVAISQQIIDNGIDVLMCGSLFGGWQEFRDICDGAKLASKDLTVVGGGGLFTFSPNEAMNFCSNCDIGILGEGEITAPSLVHALSIGKNLGKVKGIIFRSGDGLTLTGVGEYPRDLDLLPYPLISPEFEKRIPIYNEISIIGARSCPFFCTFCSLSTTKDYRKRSVDNIVNEIKYYIEKYNVTRFLFLDELFSDSVDRMNEYIEKITPLNIGFFLQSRINDNLSVSVFQGLVQAGMYNFTLGVENINDSILKSMNKGITSKMIYRCLSNIEKAGCSNKFMPGYLIGDPAETVETFAASIKFYRDNCYRFKYLAFYPIDIYPGSILYKKAVKSSRIIPKDYFEKTTFTPPAVNMTQFNDAQFLLLNYYAAYHRIEYAHNQNVELSFYRHDGKSYFKYRCHCCKENQYTVIDLNSWVDDPNKVALFMNSFRCEYCMDELCNAALKIFYNSVGKSIARFLDNHKCALRCCGYELMMFSTHIVDCNFMLIDRNIKFSADDWEEFERAIGDQPIMSRILREHPVQKSLPFDADIDTVIVLIDQYYDEIRKEVQKNRPDVNVIRYTDTIFWK